MVLSLAFILAFIGASVALLIGIIIFSQVQDDMLQTFGDPILISNGTGGGITTTDNLYTCGSFGNSDEDIHLRNKADGTSISSVAVNWTGVTIYNACNGMAQDPTDLQWYAIMRNGDTGDRTLTTVDVTTGVVNSVGAFLTGGSDQFASMAFDSSGQLFIASSNQHNFPDNLFSVDKTNANTTLLCDLQSAQSINRLAYNWDSDQLIILSESAGSLGITLYEITDTSPANCVKNTLQTSTGASYSPLVSIGHPYGFSYHTEDDVYYAMTLDNGNEMYSVIQTDSNHTLLNTHAVSGVTSPPLSTLTTTSNDLGIGFELTVGGGGSPIFESQVPPEFITASNIAYTVIGIIPVALFFFLFAIFGGRLGDG